MKIQKQIENKITQSLSPFHLEILNESYMHAVPKDAETHFKIIVVSDKFKSLPLIKRHQMLYALLQEEMKAGVHALALHTFTSEEWNKKEQIPSSPKCSKK